jgi:hypothetical protein
MLAVFGPLSWEELLLLVLLFSLLSVLTYVLMPSLTRAPGDPGIISLELAWTPTRTRTILDKWRGAHLLSAAKRGIYVDYAFLVAYAMTGALFVTLLARATGDAISDSTARHAANAGAIAMWSAGVLDAIENVGLLRLLSLNAGTGTGVLVSAIASVKFLLIGVALVITVGLVISIAV